MKATVIRRATSVLAALAILLLPQPIMQAQARMHGGIAVGGGPPPSGQVTTLMIQNTSGTTQAANFVTQIFGHPFKKGDIPNGCSGGAPQFQLTNGTNVPFSEGVHPICWNDGSLYWAPFMLRVPVSVTGSGNLTINILSGGTFPSASSRSTSELTAGGLDLNVVVTGQRNLSGTYVSNLGKGVTDANTDNYTYMDGDAGKVLRVRECFRLTNTSGSCHGQLEGYWYPQLLNDSSGGLAGIRYIFKIAQPWYDVDSPTKTWRSFSAFKVQNGASVLRDMFGTRFGVGKAFTWESSDGSQCANGVKCQLNASSTTNFDSTFNIELTNSGGALPTGLSTSTPYFSWPIASDKFALFTLNSNSTTMNDQVVAASGQCTGTCTATAYPYIVQFGSLYAAGSTGDYDYIQGSGTASTDSTVRIAFNNAYWKSTHIMPPYDLTLSVSADATTTYYPSAAGMVQRNVDPGGERGDIGPIPVWGVRHFYLQDAADEQNVIVTALAGAQMPVMLRNSTTRSIPNVRNASYTGLPTSNTSFLWEQPNLGNVAGFTAPSNTTQAWLANLDTIDFSHMPDMNVYALMISGRPEINDDLTSWASTAQVNHLGFLNPGTATVNADTNAIGGIHPVGGAQRNFTINGTTYYGITSNVGDLLRQEAWTIRTIAGMAAFGGGYEPGGAATRTYFNDTMTDQYTAEMAYIGMLPSFAQTNGFFNETTNQINGIADSWASGFLLMSTAWATALLDSPTNAVNFGNHLAKFWKFENDNFGVWNIPWYEGTQRQFTNFSIGGNSNSAPYLTDATQFAICGDTWQQNWSGSTFTDTKVPTDYVQTNGDRVRWWDYGGGDQIPSELSRFTTYYKVNVNTSTNQYQLAATQGGSPIATTGSGNSRACEVAVLHQPMTTSINNVPLGNGYMQNETGAMNWWSLVGTVDATTLTNMQNNLQSLGGGVPNEPKYRFGPSWLLPTNDNWESFAPMRMRR